MLKSINTDPRFLKHLINENIFNKHNSPFYLLDVGAANGIHSMWNVFGNNFKAIGFEPDKDSFYQLQNTENVKYENIALGEQNTHTDFYLSAHPQNSGSFPQNVKFLNRLACIDFQRPDFLNEELITLEIQTFESYIKNNSIPQVDFIKIDTEGMELKILQGYGESLDNVLGIQTEVAFCESHHGRPLFKDIDGFLQSKGFTLFDMEIFKHAKKCLPPLNETGDAMGQITSGEALYFKDFISSESLSLKDPITILKIISLFELYSHNDSAIELFLHAKQLGKFKTLNLSNTVDLLVPFVQSANGYVPLKEYIATYVPKNKTLLKLRHDEIPQKNQSIFKKIASIFSE